MLVAVDSSIALCAAIAIYVLSFEWIPKIDAVLKEYLASKSAEREEELEVSIFYSYLQY